MKNTLTDLNDHLFAALERINDEELNEEQLDGAIKRGKAVTDIAKTIISNASIQLKAVQLSQEYGIEAARNEYLSLPEMVKNKE